MKIDGPNRTQGASGTKGKSKTSPGSGNFGDMVTGAPAGAQETAATRQIARVDALLAVQAAEDPTARATRGRMVRRSDRILDELESMRLAMLSGSLTVGHMVGIADVVAAHRERIDDPEMVAIMDEIDLRAQVELAKLRVSMDGAGL
jgi:hypothetical protein